MMRLCIIRSLVLAIALLGLNCTIKQPAQAEDRALLIAINKYASADIRQLTAALNDARLMKTVASNVWGFRPEQIKLLADEQATIQGIRDAINEWLILGTRPGDRVLLFYSGHGVHVPDLDGDEKDGQDEAIAPYDVIKTKSNNYKNVLTDDELHRLLQRLTGRDVMLVADSCYSGTVTRALTPRWRSGPRKASLSLSAVRSPMNLPTFRSNGTPKEAENIDYDTLRHQVGLIEGDDRLMVWTAVSASQLAEESIAGNGAFTRAFANGLLRRRADLDNSGRISPAELLRYVRTEAENYCERRAASGDPCKTGMTPTFEPEKRATGIDLLSWGREQPNDVASPPLASLGDLFPSDIQIPMKVELLGGTRVGGEPLRVRVTSPRNGYLIVLDRRETGEVVQLFPSSCTRPSRRIRAHAPLTLPDKTYGCEFAPDKPGKGQIIVIVSEDNVPLDQLLSRHKDLEAVPEGDAYLAEITAKLLAVWTGDERNRPARWGVAAADYIVNGTK